MMDTIYIDALKVDTIIGVHAWERTTKQTVILYLEMDYDISAAAKSDDLSKACDYAEIAEQVIQFIENSQFQLIETMAEETAQLILREFKIQKVKIRVSKPGAVEGADSVGVIIKGS